MPLNAKVETSSSEPSPQGDGTLPLLDPDIRPLDRRVVAYWRLRLAAGTGVAASGPQAAIIVANIASTTSEISLRIISSLKLM